MLVVFVPQLSLIFYRFTTFQFYVLINSQSHEPQCFPDQYKRSIDYNNHKTEFNSRMNTTCMIYKITSIRETHSTLNRCFMIIRLLKSNKKLKHFSHTIDYSIPAIILILMIPRYLDILMIPI